MTGHGVTVYVEGDKKLASKFAELKRRYPQVLAREIKRAALNVESGAKRRCPVDTGRLRSSIHARFPTELHAAIGTTNVEYAAAVEFGHRIARGARRSTWREARTTLRRKAGTAGFGAKFVEVRHRSGWSKPRGGGSGRTVVPAHPFLFPAWDVERPQFLLRVQKALKGAKP